MSDANLKILLAKMLPETVKFFGKRLTWMHDFCGNRIEDGARAVRNTELLHICQLIERNHLTADEHQAFAKLVKVSDTWQQRTTALASVKGVSL